MKFRKYMHVERYGNDEVQGIELGKCYIFPKLDGTNSSVWINGDEIQAGSRKRHLSLDADNAGFLSAIKKHDSVHAFLHDNPMLRLYGEWLVPHSLKTYHDDAWKKFYVFDVYNDNKEKYLHYEELQDLMEIYGIDYIPPITIIKNTSYESLLKQLEKNTFLIKDGKGFGEGIVIKNYDFVNRFGNTIWAKIITNSFKEKHKKVLGCSIQESNKLIEQEICDKYITRHLIDKVFAKIVNEQNGWNSKYIPRLLDTVFYDLINEEIWNIIKKMKNPTINFKTLKILTTLEIKKIKSELF